MPKAAAAGTKKVSNLHIYRFNERIHRQGFNIRTESFLKE